MTVLTFQNSLQSEVVSLRQGWWKLKCLLCSFKMQGSDFLSTSHAKFSKVHAVMTYETCCENHEGNTAWPHARPKFAYYFQTCMRSRLMKRAAKNIKETSSDRAHDLNLHTISKRACGHDLWNVLQKSWIKHRLTAHKENLRTIFKGACGHDLWSGLQKS